MRAASYVEQRSRLNVGIRRADIKAKIRSEIHGQTQAQVDQQITEYIPIPLGKQLEETNTKLSQVKISIANAYVAKYS